MQSSVAASSVAEPVAPGGGAAAEEEEGQAAAQQQHQQEGPNGHHGYAAADASSAVVVEVPVGAEALEPSPPPQPDEDAAAAKEATHGVYPGENVLPFTSELRVLRPEGVGLLTVVVGVGSTVVPSPPFNSEPPTANAYPYANIPRTQQYPKHPVYRVLEPSGAVREGALEPQIEKEAARRMYGTMARLQAMDTIFYNAQRQGRVSFYMTSTGEVRVRVLYFCAKGVDLWMNGCL